MNQTHKDISYQSEMCSSIECCQP